MNFHCNNRQPKNNQGGCFEKYFHGIIFFNFIYQASVANLAPASCTYRRGSQLEGYINNLIELLISGSWSSPDHNDKRFIQRSTYLPWKMRISSTQIFLMAKIWRTHIHSHQENLIGSTDMNFHCNNPRPKTIRGRVLKNIFLEESFNISDIKFHWISLLHI